MLCAVVINVYMCIYIICIISLSASSCAGSLIKTLALAGVNSDCLLAKHLVNYWMNYNETFRSHWK